MMCLGLILFAVVVSTNVCVMLLDLVLLIHNRTTITTLVWDGNWVVGAVIITFETLGVAGLTLHFWGPRGSW